MAKVILKFNLDVGKKEQEIEMPYGSEIIKIDTQIAIDKGADGPGYPDYKDYIKIWCICPVESTIGKRKFVIIETGKQFQASDNLKYIDTVVFKGINYVAHIFEKL